MHDASLDDTLKSVFSLLPPTKADEARKALLKQLNTVGPANAEDIAWAEFTTDGRFIRGGFSSPADKSTQLVSNSQESLEIATLGQMISNGEAGAGTALWHEQTDRLYWFVPVTPSTATAVLEQRLRAFSIPQSVFAELVVAFNAEAGVTPAELRTVFQLVGNAELRHAADVDALSYETKRMHVKSLCSKLQCHGQRELSSKIIGQMVHLLSVTDGSTEPSELLESFVARYLSNDVRLHLRRLPSGRLMRYLECGPSDGREVVLIHGIMFPIILYGLSKQLHAQNIKLLIPVRIGFFENRSLASFYVEEDSMNEGLDDIADFIKAFCKPPCTIIGNSLGSVVSVNFALRHPKLAARLILLGTNLKEAQPSVEHTAAKFYGAMKSLSAETDLFKMVSWQFKKYYADERTCAAILRSLFGASQIDLDVLDGRFTTVPAYRMFSETYQHSLLGVSEDLALVMRQPNQAFASLKVPFTFVQGDLDPLTSPEELGEIQQNVGKGELRVVANAGHFLSVSHANEIWKVIGETL